MNPLGMLVLFRFYGDADATLGVVKEWDPMLRDGHTRSGDRVTIAPYPWSFKDRARKLTPGHAIPGSWSSHRTLGSVELLGATETGPR